MTSLGTMCCLGRRSTYARYASDRSDNPGIWRLFSRLPAQMSWVAARNTSELFHLESSGHRHGQVVSQQVVGLQWPLQRPRQVAERSTGNAAGVGCIPTPLPSVPARGQRLGERDAATVSGHRTLGLCVIHIIFSCDACMYIAQVLLVSVHLRSADGWVDRPYLSCQHRLLRVNILNANMID